MRPSNHTRPVSICTWPSRDRRPSARARPGSGLCRYARTWWPSALGRRVCETNTPWRRPISAGAAAATPMTPCRRKASCRWSNTSSTSPDATSAPGRQHGRQPAQADEELVEDRGGPAVGQRARDARKQLALRRAVGQALGVAARVDDRACAGPWDRVPLGAQAERAQRGAARADPPAAGIGQHDELGPGGQQSRLAAPRQLPAHHLGLPLVGRGQHAQVPPAAQRRRAATRRSAASCCDGPAAGTPPSRRESGLCSHLTAATRGSHELRELYELFVTSVREIRVIRGDLVSHFHSVSARWIRYWP